MKFFPWFYNSFFIRSEYKRAFLGTSPLPNTESRCYVTWICQVIKHLNYLTWQAFNAWDVHSLRWHKLLESSWKHRHKIHRLTRWVWIPLLGLCPLLFGQIVLTMLLLFFLIEPYLKGRLHSKNSPLAWRFLLLRLTRVLHSPFIYLSSYEDLFSSSLTTLPVLGLS